MKEKNMITWIIKGVWKLGAHAQWEKQTPSLEKWENTQTNVKEVVKEWFLSILLQNLFDLKDFHPRNENWNLLLDEIFSWLIEG